MAKRSGRRLSKKGLVGLQRITDKKEKRVWKYMSKTFGTLKDVVIFHSMNQSNLDKK